MRGLGVAVGVDGVGSAAQRNIIAASMFPKIFASEKGRRFSQKLNVVLDMTSKNDSEKEESPVRLNDGWNREVRELERKGFGTTRAHSYMQGYEFCQLGSW